MAYVGTPLDTTNAFQSLSGKRFNGDGSTTDFTLDSSPNSTLDIEVFVGNVRQDPNSAYTVSGTTLSFTGAPPSGTNNIYVVHQAKAVGTIDPAVGSTLDLNGAAELVLDADADTAISADAADDQIDIKIGGNDDFKLTAKTLSIGGAAAADSKIVFDGNAQDYHIGLDDSADSLTIGLGSTLGTTSHMVIDATGAITKPLQPSFLVKVNSTLSNVTGGGTNYDVVFATEVIDRNADFSSATFTAPITGIYALHAILEISGVTDSMTQCVAFFNASNRTYYIKNDDGGNYHTSSELYINCSAVIDMDANDTVTLQLDFRNGSDVADIGTGSHWGGYLVA
jgi:hypothetical protein